MSKRVFLFAAICLFSNCLSSVAQQTPVAPAAQGAPTLVVIPCKYMKASEAQSLLQQVFGNLDCRIAADMRTNSILFSGSQEMLKRYADYIKVIDLPAASTAEPAQLVKTPADFLLKNMNLITQSAASSGVESAMDSETGLIMLKGKKESVGEVQAFIERLKAVADGRPTAEVKPSSVVIRVLWLTNGQLPTEVVADNDPKLQQIIDRLAKQGVKDLVVGMQVMSRCDPHPERPGQCKLSGRVDLKDYQQELFVDARLSQLQSSQTFTGKIEIQAIRTPLGLGFLSKSTVRVDVNAETNKYYVLSSAPLGNQHSVFVVQLLDDF